MLDKQATLRLKIRTLVEVKSCMKLFFSFDLSPGREQWTLKRTESTPEPHRKATD